MLKHLATMMAVAVPLSAQQAVAGAPTGSRVSAAVPTLRFAHVRLRTGVRLHYAEQGDPQGEPLILLHGLGDSWYSFSSILPKLPASFHVFAIDQRGHGDSERPASGYTLADLSDDAVAFMDAMGITRATRVMRAALDGLLASGDSARLGSIRAPTVVVWGERDAVFARAEQLELYRRIGGAELLTYPGIGHSPHWEAPDRFVRDLLGFIKRRGAR